MKWFTIIVVLVCVFSFSLPYQVHAQEQTKPEQTVSQKLDEQINELKEKIASRVSELDLVEKRGIVGTVTEVKTNQITLKDITGETRFVDVDEITKFSSGSNNANFGISDLKSGTQISVLGNYNKQSKRLLARFVKTHTNPNRYSGSITKINAPQYQVTMITAEGKEITMDIETNTDTFAYTKEAGLVRYGFSKLADGDRIIVLGYPSQSNTKLLSIDRLIDFINLPPDPQIQSAKPTAVEENVTIAPTGAGGKNIEPIN